MRAAFIGVFGLLTACSSPPNLEVGDPVPEVGLVDVNASSDTFGETVELGDYTGSVSVWYFGHANCPYCLSQFIVLDEIQAELESQGVEAHIIGLNAYGYQASNEDFTENVTLPWLQDTDGQTWARWSAVWRDIFIVDAQGVLRERDNLTTYDLREEENRTLFTDAIIDLASE